MCYLNYFIVLSYPRFPPQPSPPALLRSKILLSVSGEVLPDVFRNIFFQFIALDDGYMLGKPNAEPSGGDCPKSQTFLSENRESASVLVYG